MQIIDELEPDQAGTVRWGRGLPRATPATWTPPSRSARLSVPTGGVHVQAGAGIVADSVPELEYQETQNKAAALFRAIEVAAAQQGW